ncbi:acyl carrier protein [Nibribacter ruber]|uniref:Acyl carrier protein n=1 Tax=Nibribacter ruber TaxID=2698458 RepID=A0A6P1NXN5_9BACT|nr:acyl carrier protein [Nibribacter ruber]QHL86959.1 acyl carrier protein [Nibribacter ruber]
MDSYTNRLRYDVACLISDLKNLETFQLLRQPHLEKHGLELLDVVDIILEVEKKYGVEITDDLPVFTLDDFAHIIEMQQYRQAS